MLQQLSSNDRQNLENSITLGNFSPETFLVRLNTSSLSSLENLSNKWKSVFRHELSHLFHYLSTYLGLTDLRYWIASIDVLQTGFEGKSDEEITTIQAGILRGLARERQILRIDEDYYFEIDKDNCILARQCPADWKVREVVGCLFDTNGKLTNHKFFASRFYIGDPIYQRSFIRIPLGLGTALEHAAKTIDFIHTINSEDVVDLAPFFKEAGEPDLLRYYCLTHWISPRVERQYGKEVVWKTFLVSGMLLAIICEIPFDSPEVWSSLKSYASKHKPYLLEHMEFPHPSFLFPLLTDAFFECDFDLSTFNLSSIETALPKILTEVGLPSLSELRYRTHEIRDDIMGFLGHSGLEQAIASLLDWIFACCDRTTWVQKIFGHAVSFPNHPPTPILFNDGYCLEGTFLKMEHVLKLTRLARRRDEMLRYLVTRDIINKNTNVLSMWREASQS